MYHTPKKNTSHLNADVMRLINLIIILFKKNGFWGATHSRELDNK